MNENQLRDEVAAGERADQLLRHPAFVSATEAVRIRLMDAWVKSAPLDTAAREVAYHQLAALDAVLSEIGQVVKTGQIARKQLKG